MTTKPKTPRRFAHPRSLTSLSLERVDLPWSDDIFDSLTSISGRMAFLAAALGSEGGQDAFLSGSGASDILLGIKAEIDALHATLAMHHQATRANGEPAQREA